MDVLVSVLITFFIITGGYTAYKIKTYHGIYVVDKKEVKKILIKYELIDQFKEGKIICPITKAVINYNNVGIIRKSESLDKPVFISNSIDVMRKASEYTDELLYKL